MSMLTSLCISNLILAISFLFASCQNSQQSAKPAGTTVVSDTFEYKALYTPSNIKEMQQSLHTNHVDYDWDLWGHNLKKVIGNHLTKDMQAEVNGQRTDKQYCFSSKALYAAIEAYILDQYGEGTNKYAARISIMPLDNRLACTCHQCKELGNTDGNATPAVTAFVSRLAKRFPHHLFFTSAYHTTMAAPATSLPANVGVFISSINLPMMVKIEGTKGYDKFLQTVKAWQKCCSRIYIWEYERNYDDYLSPFPCLLVLQTRLQLYRSLGIKGIFINGSGDDYSSFDDMQSYVLAKMMDNPDLDVRQTILDYYRQHYPHTSELLFNYYWGLEQRVRQKNCELPLYGTMQDMVDTYLDPSTFISFRQKLDAASKATTGDERHRLNALLTALAFTQLQLYRLPSLANDAEQAAEMRIVLKGHTEIKGMKNYDESGRSINDYLKSK